MYDVTFGNEFAVEAHALRTVVLEYKAELALLRERADLGCQLTSTKLERLVNKPLYLCLRSQRHLLPPVVIADSYKGYSLWVLIRSETYAVVMALSLLLACRIEAPTPHTI